MAQRCQSYRTGAPDRYQQVSPQKCVAPRPVRGPPSRRPPAADRRARFGPFALLCAPGRFHGITVLVRVGARCRLIRIALIRCVGGTRILFTGLTFVRGVIQPLNLVDLSLDLFDLNAQLWILSRDFAKIAIPRNCKLRRLLQGAFQAFFELLAAIFAELASFDVSKTSPEMLYVQEGIIASLDNSLAMLCDGGIPLGVHLALR